MSVLDIKIWQDWGEDGYTFDKDAREEPRVNETELPQQVTITQNIHAADPGAFRGKRV